MDHSPALHDLASFADWVDLDACEPGPPLEDTQYDLTLTPQQPLTEPSLPSCPIDTLHPDKLRLLQYEEWDQRKDYTEDKPPTCIRYTVEWRVVWKGGLRSKILSTDTELDVVLNPACLWKYSLSSKVDAVRDKKLPVGTTGELEDIDVVVSVNHSKEHDISLRFDEVNSAWPQVKAQILKWSSLFQDGREIRVAIRFNYKDRPLAERGASSSTNSTTGRPSATRTMLTERARQMDAEHSSTGEPVTWQYVYSIMRCTCGKSRHCWRDSGTKTHYPMKAHHMRELIKYVEGGGELISHDDMPHVIREQLYAEDSEASRQSKNTGKANLPVNIIMPSLGASFPASDLTASHPAPSGLAGTGHRPGLKIFGSRDKATKDFCEWQQTKFDDPDWKNDYKKAYDILSVHKLDLENLYEDGDHEFLIKEGLKRGPARHMIRDIPDWVKKFKRGKFTE